MRAATTIDVTYTGTDEPFIDRIYGTRLTFEPGQTRPLAPDLAARFLRHTDVFKGPEVAAEDEGKKTSKKNPEGKTTDPNDQTPPADNTAAQLAEAERLAEEQRKQENARFELHQSLDGMTKAGLRDFVKVNYKQDLPEGKVADMRAQAKSMLDQFGAP